MSTGTRRAIQDALFYARSHARFVDAAASFCVHAFVYVSMRDLHSLGRVRGAQRARQVFSVCLGSFLSRRH